MAIDDQTRQRKLQYDINRGAAKISTLLPDKIYKYEYFTGEEKFPTQQHRLIEDTKVFNLQLVRHSKNKSKE